MKRPMMSFLALVLMPLAMLSYVPQTQAQEQRCFPETGYCISGAIYEYWDFNGGLPVFGYPITDQRVETIEGWTGPVQWFERDRLEDHGTDGVMAGRLGARILELQGEPWQTFPQVSDAPAGCTFFPETGHSLCDPFYLFWEKHGGVHRFGYPITEAHQKTIGDWTGTVQYFERRRMEHHLENAGTPYEILFGLLGNEVLAKLGKCGNEVLPELQSAYDRANFTEELGCPGEVIEDIPAAIQNMENGLMLWVDYGEDTQQVYAIWTYGRYKSFKDTWREGMDERPNVNPPNGLFAPVRGFGKVWTDDPSVRSDLGWAVEEHERATTATVQLFDHGRMIWLKDSDMVYILGPEEWNAQYLSRQ